MDLEMHMTQAAFDVAIIAMGLSLGSVLVVLGLLIRCDFIKAKADREYEKQVWF